VQSSIEKAHHIFSSVVREEEEQRPRAPLEVTFIVQKERKGAAGSRAKKEKKKDLETPSKHEKREISSHVPRGVEFHERAL
jgi:hypothetical protein